MVSELRRDHGSEAVTYSLSGYPDAGPVVGMAYLLDEPEYCFGIGRLLVVVRRVIGPSDFGNNGRVETWWHVEGDAKPRGAGTHPAVSREVYLRADRIAVARQRAAHDATTRE